MVHLVLKWCKTMQDNKTHHVIQIPEIENFLALSCQSPQSIAIVYAPLSLSYSFLQIVTPFNQVFIYLEFQHCTGRFQHCTGHITMGSWEGIGNQYVQFIRVLYCKLPTNGKQLPAFPLEAVLGTKPRPQRWEARVLPFCRGPPLTK